MTAPYVIDPRTGEQLPPFLPLSRAARLCGKSKDWVKAQCQSGTISALQHDAFAHWAIPTAALLRLMGIEPQIAPTAASLPLPPLGDLTAGSGAAGGGGKPPRTSSAGHLRGRGAA